MVSFGQNDLPLTVTASPIAALDLSSVMCGVSATCDCCQF